MSVLGVITLLCAVHRLFGQPTSQIDKMVYCNVRELQNVDQAAMVLTLSSNSASFWMDQEGYPISGTAMLSKSALTIVYTNLPRSISGMSSTRTQVWDRATIKDRDFLLGPVAVQHLENHGLIAYDALVRLSHGESTNKVPMAEAMGINIAK